MLLNQEAEDEEEINALDLNNNNNNVFPADIQTHTSGPWEHFTSNYDTWANGQVSFYMIGGVS